MELSAHGQPNWCSEPVPKLILRGVMTEEATYFIDSGSSKTRKKLGSWFPLKAHTPRHHFVTAEPQVGKKVCNIWLFRVHLFLKTIKEMRPERKWHCLLWCSLRTYIISIPLHFIDLPGFGEWEHKLPLLNGGAWGHTGRSTYRINRMCTGGNTVGK